MCLTDWLADSLNYYMYNANSCMIIKTAHILHLYLTNVHQYCIQSLCLLWFRIKCSENKKIPDTEINFRHFLPCTTYKHFNQNETTQYNTTRSILVYLPVTCKSVGYKHAFICGTHTKLYHTSCYFILHPSYLLVLYVHPSCLLPALLLAVKYEHSLSCLAG